AALALALGDRVEACDQLLEPAGALAASERSVLDESAEAALEQQALVNRDDRSGSRRVCCEQVGVVLGALRVAHQQMDLEDEQPPDRTRKEPEDRIRDRRRRPLRRENTVELSQAVHRRTDEEA